MKNFQNITRINHNKPVTQVCDIYRCSEFLFPTRISKFRLKVLELGNAITGKFHLNLLVVIPKEVSVSGIIFAALLICDNCNSPTWCHNQRVIIEFALLILSVDPTTTSSTRCEGVTVRMSRFPCNLGQNKLKGNSFIHIYDDFFRHFYLTTCLAISLHIQSRHHRTEGEWEHDKTRPERRFGPGMIMMMRIISTCRMIY